ncbi:MAG TPA: oligosaccharide flippase family protein [Bacteroidales bacterium]|nr:oligosaccharide flippase family protein [Bacteroidales bacterium]HNR41298.1 oligosaccharide flippase family protein [Bacteroidales bacterium]HPM87484.1 oligosaccharide flippase family protein [Bacteroidales bacterium]HQG76007.1 oligosaccharide flippase family protein [Bacteroidales bacterium]
MNEIRKLAGQTVIYGMGTIIPRFLHYAVMTPFYTRIFYDSTSGYGVITELYAWMVILLVILTYGMETAFFRFAQKSDDPDSVFSTALISLFATSLLFVSLVFIFIEPVSRFMNYENNRDYIRLFAGIVAVDAFCAIPFAKLRKENRPLLFSSVKIANVSITIILVVFLLKIAPEIWGRSTGLFHRIYNPDYKVGYVFIANLVSSSATMVMLLPVILKTKLRFDPGLWHRMVNYGFPLMLAGVSGTINDALDKIIIRRLIGEAEGLSVVGKYGAGYKIGVLMALFIQMFRFAAEPFFFERARQSDAKETYAYVMKYFIIVMLVIFLGINLYISGLKYIIALPYREAIVVVPMISMGYLLYGIYINHSIWYKLNDFTVFAVYITLIGAAVTVLINVIFVPVYGYIAAAWAHVASYGAMIIASFAMAEKRYKVEYKMKQYIPYFILASGMVYFAQNFRYPGIVVELLVNSGMIVLFIAYAQYRDKVLTVFSGKGK